MKLAIICRPRTASTALVHSLSEQYEIPNLSEHYLNKSISLPIHSDSYNKFRKVKNLPTPESQFQNNITSITKDLEKEDSFVLKIFPRMFVVPTKFTLTESETPSVIKDKILFNLTDSMHFDMYDKIYLLDRDLYTSCASWVYSVHTRSFFITRDRSKKDQPPIILNQKDYDTLRFFILENVLYDKIINYLESKKFSFMDVTNSLSEHIGENSPIPKSNRNFPNLIEDYENMCNFIDQYHAYCVDETKDWFFY